MHMTKLSKALFGSTLTLALAAAFAGAQATPKDVHGAEHSGHTKMSCPMMDEHDDAAQEAADIANIKVENTKLGATIQLTAKNASDAAKVQELARDLAASFGKRAEHAKHGQ
jgi:hypothetical protein